MKVGLVACSKQKVGHPAPAGDLYTSPLFEKAKAYCIENYDCWFILSAKYGLLDPSATVEPYDETLNGMPAAKRKQWAKTVLAQIILAGLRGEQFFFHAGNNYREYLAPHLDSESPLEGLGIGQQLAWYVDKQKTGPQFYCVVGNRDHLKLFEEDGTFRKAPIWEFIEGDWQHWLTSLVYLRGMEVPPGHRFIDCGAWSYKTENEPRWSPVECAERYQEICAPGDIVASPDHMVLKDLDANEEVRRIALTLRNAKEFKSLIAPNLVPIGVTHGNSIENRIAMTKELLDMGYGYIGIGSVAPRAGARKWVRALLEETAKLRDTYDFRLHVLGISALSWYHEFKQYGVDSYDGSSMFFSAFTGASYYWTNETGDIVKYSVKDLKPWAIPACECPACLAMRGQGIDTRTLGSNESNMGRAVHNINIYLRAMERVRSLKPSFQETLSGWQ